MSLAVFVSPKQIRILDPNSNPIDVWVIEFPFWLAKYLCEQKAENENAQQAKEICQSISPLYHYSVDHRPIPGVTDDELLTTQRVPDGIQHEPLQDYQFDLEDTTAENLLNDNPNVDCSMQPPKEDIPMCVHAQIAPFDTSRVGNLRFDSQSRDVSENQQLPLDRHYEENSGSSTLNQPEFSIPYFPDAPFLPMGFHTDEVCPLNFYNASVPENFIMHDAENGGFFIENKLSKISGYVRGSLLDWGLSHPLGHLMKNKRGLFGYFILNSGNVCYVKCTPYSIKFSSQQRGVSYVIDEAGVRTCWESFKSLEELISERDNNCGQIIRPQVFMKNRCDCGTSSCLHSFKEMWNSEEENIRIQRKGLRFFSETRELMNLSLDLHNFHLNSTLRHVGDQDSDGHIFVKNWQSRFIQSVSFNGKSLQVKFHTQTARLNSYGRLSLSEH